MIWYKVILTNNELFNGLGRELEADFNYLFRILNHPEDMKLYCSWLVGDQHRYYYLQMPENFGFHLGEVFLKYRTVLSTEPETDKLQILIGCESMSETS